MNALLSVLGTLLAFGLIYVAGICAMVLQIFWQIPAKEIEAFSKAMDKQKRPTRLEVYLPVLLVGLIAILATNSVQYSLFAMAVADSLLTIVRLQFDISSFNKDRS